MKTYRTAQIHELAPGDIVNCHGMRCLVEEPMKLSTTHAGGRTYYTDARVLNRAEVPAHRVPLSFTARADGVHRWVIQSNDLARWAVEA